MWMWGSTPKNVSSDEAGGRPTSRRFVSSHVGTAAAGRRKQRGGFVLYLASEHLRLEGESNAHSHRRIQKMHSPRVAYPLIRANDCPPSLLSTRLKVAISAVLFFTLPLMLPLLIVFSPVLVFCFLFTIGFASFLRCIWRLRDTDAEKPGHGFKDQKAINWQDGLLEPGAGLWDDGWFHSGRLDVDGVKQSRVHAYLDDQLRNVVRAVKRSNGDGDLVLCSFLSGGD